MEYVLWGKHPSYADGDWIKISGGTLNQCVAEKKRRKAEDDRWKLLAMPPRIHPLDELGTVTQ